MARAACALLLSQGQVTIVVAVDFTASRWNDRSHARSFELYGIFRREPQGNGATAFHIRTDFEAGVTFVSHRSHRR